MDKPSPNGDNGRESNGRFGKGNPGGPGNPHAARIGQLRSAMIESVTDEDLRAIIRKMIDLAKSGDIRAAKEILDRVLGKSQEADLIERLEQLERQLAKGAWR